MSEKINLFNEIPEHTRNFLFSKTKNKTIAFPEDDPRILKACEILTSQLEIKCLIGSKEFGQKNKNQTLTVLKKTSEKRGKALPTNIEELAEDPTFGAGAALYCGDVDAVVSGCRNTTAHVIKAALSTVGLQKNTHILTSGFLLALPHATPGGESLLLYSDCAVIPKPTEKQLTSIAILAAHSFQSWTNIPPRVSFLSYSTLGSASSPEIISIQNACDSFQKQYPEILCEGEVQFDAACSPEVSLRKNSLSKIQGQTNVFIFPDLNSGNIGYKMTQYLAGAKAWGPILLGCARPFSDLSRGASPADIAHSAILALALA